MISKVFTLLMTLSIFVIPSDAQSRFEKDTGNLRVSKMKDDTIKVFAYLIKSLETAEYDLELSKFYAQKCMTLAEQLKYARGLTYSYDAMGNYYLQKGKFVEAYEWMNKSIRLKEKRNSYFELAVGYDMLAILFRQMSELEMALKFSRKSVHNSKILKKDRYIALSITALSNIHHEMGELDSALYYNQYALDIYKKLNEIGSMALCYTNQGNIYEEKKDLKTALEKHLKAREIVEENDIRLRLIIETNLADHYLLTNEIEKAGRALENLKKIPRESAEAEQEMEIYKLYSQYHFKTNDFKEAYLYQKKFQSKKDSLDDLTAKRSVFGHEIKYQTEKKEKENQLLKQKSKIDQLTIEDSERKSFQLKLIIGASGLILVLLVFVIVNRIRSSRKLSEQNEQINKQNETLKSLNRDLIESEDELQKSNDVKAELLSIISHDISSPVNSLYNYQGSILSKINQLNKEELAGDLIRINEQTKQVHALVNNLLDYCYTQQNGFIKKETEIHLKKLAEECISLFHHSIEDKKLKLEIEKLKDISIKSDINLVRLIIRNLLSNAIKFSPKNETIVFSYENGVFSISNKGEKLNTSMIEALKSGNNQETTLGTAGEKGTGLGMKIVRNAIELLKTEFIVETDSERGNVFGVRV